MARPPVFFKSEEATEERSLSDSRDVAAIRASKQINRATIQNSQS
jgi:hypothetical protein